MQYLEVAVDHKTVRGTDTLTYTAQEPVNIGDIVRVPLRKAHANGVVIKKVAKPSYTTKPIAAVLYSPGIPKHLLKTLFWIKDYYNVDLSQAIQLALPRGVHKKRHSNKDVKDVEISHRDQSHKLSAEQVTGFAQIQKHPHNTIVVHGVTGSGKTRLYIEAIKHNMAKGKGTILLVPEIGLTSQMVSDIMGQFKTTFVLHSQITERNRHAIWERIQKSDTPIVIGPRSALFAPIQKLGLIIVDEEHEQTYKQDQAPKYNAIRVASVLSKTAHAQLLLGSATPSVEDYYLAKERRLPIIELTKSIKSDVNKTTIDIVNLKDRNNFKKGNSLLSDTLLDGIELALTNEQQALIFLNRRGSSTALICASCGWHAECPQCYLPLTHHGDWQKLVCHVCNWQTDILLSCPKCNEAKLLYKGIGTKQIVSELRKIYPNKNIARFDADTKKDEQLAQKYQDILDKKIDIIVGTQMIAKGLDIPGIAMVGVVLADASLYLPDYTANERTFQLISQVIGRTGRHNHGHVIIQTYAPDNPILTYAAEKDYKRFYEQEIRERQKANYPPFTYLLKLTCERVQLATVQKATAQLALTITNKYPNVTVLGPSPALHERTKQGYKWQLVIKSSQRGTLQDIIAHDLPANWQHDIDPLTLL